MESQMWERIRNQELDYADEDFGAFQEPMSVIDQEEALKLYDAGADIYLITNFSSPIYVTERMEIERGPEHYQMSTEELERFRNLEWKMQKYPQIQSLKEANLLLGTRRTFGIYQIKDDSPGENYAFMNLSFIESHGMQIKKKIMNWSMWENYLEICHWMIFLNDSILTDQKTSVGILCQ